MADLKDKWALVDVSQARGSQWMEHVISQKPKRTKGFPRARAASPMIESQAVAKSVLEDVNLFSLRSLDFIWYTVENC